MTSREKRRELRDQLAAIEADGDGSDSSASSVHSESDFCDDAGAAAAVVGEGIAMVREPEPSIEGVDVADAVSE
jgi:hypothetical protein